MYVRLCVCVCVYVQQPTICSYFFTLHKMLSRWYVGRLYRNVGRLWRGSSQVVVGNEHLPCTARVDFFRSPLTSPSALISRISQVYPFIVRLLMRPFHVLKRKWVSTLLRNFGTRAKQVIYKLLRPESTFSLTWTPDISCVIGVVLPKFELLIVQS